MPLKWFGLFRTLGLEFRGLGSFRALGYRFHMSPYIIWLLLAFSKYGGKGQRTLCVRGFRLFRFRLVTQAAVCSFNGPDTGFGKGQRRVLSLASPSDPSTFWALHGGLQALQAPGKRPCRVALLVLKMGVGVDPWVVVNLDSLFGSRRSMCIASRFAQGSDHDSDIYLHPSTEECLRVGFWTTATPYH